MTTTALTHALTPCDCRLSHETAATCPREPRGELVWTPTKDGRGPIEVVAPSGERETLAFGHEWLHFDEQLARGHASIRHLDFKVGAL